MDVVDRGEVGSGQLQSGKVQVFEVDSAGVQPVAADVGVPLLSVVLPRRVYHDQRRERGLASLDQSQCFEALVWGAEAARTKRDSAVLSL